MFSSPPHAVSPYRILLTGTLAVGKTTLSEHLQQLQLPGVTIVPETTLELIHQGYDPLSPTFLAHCLTHQLQKEKALAAFTGNAIISHSSARPILILDQGILDLIAYANCTQQTIQPFWYSTLSYHHTFILDKDDLYFELQQFPRQVPPRADWPELRVSIQAELLRLAKKQQLKFSLLSGSLEERLSIVKTFIEHL